MGKTENSLRKRIALGLTLGLMLAAGPSQAEFYKWTDESGQVHYTQTPPPKQQAEKIKVDTGTPTSAVIPLEEKRDGPKVCGTLTLPQKRLDAVTNIAMYRNAIGIWQKYIDDNEKKSDEASLQGVADRHCAIEYANRELQALSEVEQGMNTNYESIRGELEELRQSVTACEDPDARDEELSMEACKRQYQPRIHQLEKMQRGMVAPEKMQ